MDIHNKKMKAGLLCLLTLMLGFALLLWGLGTAYAHYESGVSRTIKMAYTALTDQIYIRGIENNDSTEGGSGIQAENSYAIDFVLSNGTANDAYCTYDQAVNLSLFATAGMSDPEKFEVTLTDGGNTYVARCSEVVEGTALYSLYGPGWVYHFFNAAGEEITWSFPGIRLIERRMNIVVTGTSEFPIAFSIIAGAVPEDI